MAAKSRSLVVTDEANPGFEVSQKRALEQLEWESLRPDPVLPKPKPLTKEEIEEIQRRRAKTKAEVETFTYWSLQDMELYFNKEQRWIKDNVVSKLDYQTMLGHIPHYLKEDVFNKIQGLRTPTDKLKAHSALSKK